MSLPNITEHSRVNKVQHSTGTLN
uniref:Uncharacterized protein n=1 Tax=Arundo donax TaxID=35708 RepID=A0A0A8YQE5_ARUDO